MSAEHQRFAIGEKADWIYGMPGADIDECEIVEYLGAGKYLMKHQVFGQGEWHTREACDFGPDRIGRLRKRTTNSVTGVSTDDE